MIHVIIICSSKSSVICKNPQISDATTNKCVCKGGYKMNEDVRVVICPVGTFAPLKFHRMFNMNKSS